MMHGVHHIDQCCGGDWLAQGVFSLRVLPVSVLEGGGSHDHTSISPGRTGKAI